MTAPHHVALSHLLVEAQAVVVLQDLNHAQMSALYLLPRDQEQLNSVSPAVHLWHLARVPVLEEPVSTKSPLAIYS